MLSDACDFVGGPALESISGIVGQAGARPRPGHCWLTYCCACLRRLVMFSVQMAQAGT